jgi:hypothetical protein
MICSPLAWFNFSALALSHNLYLRPAQIVMSEYNISSGKAKMKNRRNLVDYGGASVTN